MEKTINELGLPTYLPTYLLVGILEKESEGIF